MAGRTLQRAKGVRPLVAVCLPLLIGTDGALKMSKSTGNSILIDEAPSEQYGKLMSIPDSLITNYFTLLTDVPGEELQAIEKGIVDGSMHPMDTKKRLARTIVAMLHGEEAAEAAQAEFERVFQQGAIPEEFELTIKWDDLPFQLQPTGFSSVEELKQARRADMPDFVNVAKLVSQSFGVSMSEARRLVQQGAVRVNGKVVNMTAAILGDSIVQVGPHRFLKVVD